MPIFVLFRFPYYTTLIGLMFYCSSFHDIIYIYIYIEITMFLEIENLMRSYINSCQKCE